MTCPMFRQHGARDHTAIWFYGSEDEKILGDIIKLRAGPLKPYIVGELAKLNETGRPFNRPLMWDFPADAKTCAPPINQSAAACDGVDARLTGRSWPQGSSRRMASATRT